MGKYKLPWNNFVPQTFGDAVSYEQQIKYLAQRLQKLEEEGMPTPDLNDLKRRVTELETDVLTIQNELQELDVETITARLEAVDEAITALETEQANQSVELTSHGTRLTTLENTVETQQGSIDTLTGRVAETTQAINRVADDLTQVTQDVEGKQDKLTAGTNITIENNVISAQATTPIILDTEVTEDSQHAVTSEGIYNAIETAKSTLQTAHTADITRIDGELNTKATTASVTALRTDVEGDISRIETEYKEADGEIDTRLDSLEASQTATDESVATLNTNVSNLQQTQTSQGTTLTGLGNRMTTAEGNITQLQTDTSELSGTVQGMQTTIQGKQDKLTAGTNITIENNIISATGGSQVTLDDTVTETSSNGVKSSGIYTAIETAKSGLQESITDIDGRVDTLEADNTTNKEDITWLTTKVSSSEETLWSLQTGLQQEISDRDAADQALRLSINGNSSDINTLRTNTETSIQNLQTGLNGKQDTLTAGTNITIDNNVISSTGGQLVAGATISQLGSAIAVSSESSAIKAPDVVKQHGVNGQIAVRLPSDVFVTSRAPLITLPVYDKSTVTSEWKAFPVRMYCEQPNVLYFTDYNNVIVSKTRFYNGGERENRIELDTFSSFASNPFFCPDTRVDLGGMDSEDLSESDDANLTCYEIPISWRPNVLNQNTYPANYTSLCINMNKRIMKGYAVYTFNNTGGYPTHCIGVMWVEPLYDTVRITDNNDLILMNMKCTRWVKYWDNTVYQGPIAIIPIY